MSDLTGTHRLQSASPNADSRSSRFRRIAFLTLVFLSSVGFAQADAADPVFAAYLPAWGVGRIEEGALRESGLTHLIYAFVKPVLSKEDTRKVALLADFSGNGFESAEGGTAAFRTFLELCEATEIRKLVSVGGWGSSEHFSDLAADHATRTLFGEAVANFVATHGLDGVDLDWEYPVEGGADGTMHREEDSTNLVKLALAVRRALDRTPGGTDLILTAAIPGNADSLAQRYRLAPMANAVNWFNLMAYDFAGPWSVAVAHNAPLRTTGDDGPGAASVAGAAAAAMAQGVPPGKIVLGISLAGVRFEGVAPKGETWLGAPFESVDTDTALEGWNDYRNLVPDVLYPLDTADWTLRWDDAGRAALLTSESTGSAISFESVGAAVAKADFARDRGLRGLMFWSADKDGPGLPLIQAAIKEARGD